MVGTHWPGCSDSRYLVALPDTREDVNDAERLRHDPAMRWIVGGKAAQGCAASPSQMGRFETQWLAAGKNLSALADLSGQWIGIYEFDAGGVEIYATVALSGGFAPLPSVVDRIEMARRSGPFSARSRSSR